GATWVGYRGAMPDGVAVTRLTLECARQGLRLVVHGGERHLGEVPKAAAHRRPKGRGDNRLPRKGWGHPNATRGTHHSPRALMGRAKLLEPQSRGTDTGPAGKALRPVLRCCRGRSRRTAKPTPGPAAEGRLQ